MRSPITALLWEIWRRGRAVAALSLTLLAACAVAVRIFPKDSPARADIEPFYWLAMVISLALVFAMFHQAEFNPRKNWHGFPYRLFSLPVPTRLLVGVPMVAGVLTLEAVYCLWARLVFAPLDRSVGPWPGATVGAGLLCYQAIVWGLAGFRLTRIVALAAAGMLLMNIASLPLFALVYTRWDMAKVHWIMGGALALAGIASVAGAWRSVETQRRGGGRGRGWLMTLFARLGDAMPRRRKGFKSAAGAQFWLEWRRAGWLLPACVGATILLIFVPYSWLARDEHDTASLTLDWVLLTPLILAAVLGKGFAKPDFWSGELALPPFFAVRPIASGEIVVSKMKVAALSAALSWLLVLVFLGAWLPLWANLKDLQGPWDRYLLLWGSSKLCVVLVLLLAAAAILTWSLLVGSFWPVLSGSKKLCAIAAVIGVVWIGLAIWGVVRWVHGFDWERLEQYVNWLGWGLATAVVAKLWLAVFSWRGISPQRAWRYALLWTGATACFVVLGLLVCPDVFWVRHLVILVALLFVPLARLGFAPRALEANRHR